MSRVERLRDACGRARLMYELSQRLDEAFPSGVNRSDNEVAGRLLAEIERLEVEVSALEAEDQG